MQRKKSPASGKVIFRENDTDHLVEVIDSNTTRSLYFGTEGCQSEMSLQNPYALLSDYLKKMVLSLLFQPNPRSLLVLGLGGGSLPKFLWKALPSCQVDVLERSSLVADVCFRYFGLPKSSRLQIHLIDALEFLTTRESQYDLLFIDLFDRDGVPKWLEETPFFPLCRKRLKNKKSVLVWNFFLRPSENQAHRLISQAVAAFEGNVILFPTKNGRNYVLMAFPEPIQFPTPWEMTERTSKLEKRMDFPFFQVWSEVVEVIKAAHHLDNES